MGKGNVSVARGLVDKGEFEMEETACVVQLTAGQLLKRSGHQTVSATFQTLGHEAAVMFGQRESYYICIPSIG